MTGYIRYCTGQTTGENPKRDIVCDILLLRIHVLMCDLTEICQWGG